MKLGVFSSLVVKETLVFPQPLLVVSYKPCEGRGTVLIPADLYKEEGSEG